MRNHTTVNVLEISSCSEYVLHACSTTIPVTETEFTLRVIKIEFLCIILINLSSNGY